MTPIAVVVTVGYVWNEVWRIGSSLWIEFLIVLAWYWLFKNLGSF
jgi:hypothetical protein